MRTRETPPYLPPEGIALVGRTHAHGELAAFGEIKPGLQGLGVGEELHCRWRLPRLRGLKLGVRARGRAGEER